MKIEFPTNPGTKEDYVFATSNGFEFKHQIKDKKYVGGNCRQPTAGSHVAKTSIMRDNKYQMWILNSNKIN